MTEPVILTKMEQEYLLRIIESAVEVHDARQFFLWSQGQLQALLPHQLLVCLQFAPDGTLRCMESVHGSVIDNAVLDGICGQGAGLAVQLARHCSNSDAFPCMSETRDPALPRALAPFKQQLAACGFDNVLINGSGSVCGGATVFMLFGLPMRPSARHAFFLALLLPQLHLALGRLTHAAPQRASGMMPGRRSLSMREEEVMRWLRAGNLNEDIAQIMGLSALTVKNHLQRMYKALGVRNRTEAVARSAPQ